MACICLKLFFLCNSVKNILRTELQETYEVEDTFFYDDATTDKSSTYDVANRVILNRKSTGTVTLAHNNNKYDITASGMGNFGLINIPELTGLNKPFELSVDVISTSNMFGLQLNNDCAEFAFGQSQNNIFGLYYTDRVNGAGWGTINEQSVSIFNNTKIVCQFNGNTMVITVYDNTTNNQLYSYTRTLQSALNNETNTVNYGLFLSNGSYSFKNLKVKPL